MFFGDWDGVARTVIVGVFAYAALLIMLLLSGKRTLSKMNSFDFIVTVALGSTLATILLSKDVPLVEGLVAFAVLIALQFAITWFSVRSPAFGNLVKSEPTLLYFRGHTLHDALREQRVTEAEVLAAVREQGIGSLGNVTAVVLETNGAITVLRDSQAGDTSALADLNRPANS